MYVQYLAVRDIIKMQAAANATMRNAEAAAQVDAVKGASQVKSPKL
jgi:hypothetical protein